MFGCPRSLALGDLGDHLISPQNRKNKGRSHRSGLSVCYSLLPVFLLPVFPLPTPCLLVPLVPRSLLSCHPERSGIRGPVRPNRSKVPGGVKDLLLHSPCNRARLQSCRNRRIKVLGFSPCIRLSNIIQPHEPGCPILGAPLSLHLGWESNEPLPPEGARGFNPAKSRKRSIRPSGPDNHTASTRTKTGAPF